MLVNNCKSGAGQRIQPEHAKSIILMCLFSWVFCLVTHLRLPYASFYLSQHQLCYSSPPSIVTTAVFPPSRTETKNQPILLNAWRTCTQQPISHSYKAMIRSSRKYSEVTRPVARQDFTTFLRLEHFKFCTTEKTFLCIGQSSTARKLQRKSAASIALVADNYNVHQVCDLLAL